MHTLTCYLAISWRLYRRLQDFVDAFFGCPILDQIGLELLIVLAVMAIKFINMMRVVMLPGVKFSTQTTAVRCNNFSQQSIATP